MSGSTKFIGLLLVATILGAGTASSSGYKFGHDDDLPLYLTRTLDVAAQDSGSPGNTWVGTGIPATNFLVQINPDAGVELGLKAHLRQGPDVPPAYVDDDGRVHVVVPSGPQLGVPNRAAWNFTFSVNAALAGAKPSLEDYEVELLIDLDPSKRTDFLKLKLDKLGPPEAAPGQHNGYGWKSGSTVAIPDDEGTDRVTQNSQNLAFYASAIDTNPKQPGIQPYTFGPGEFDVVLSIKKKHGHWHGHKHGHNHWGGGHELARVHAIFDVVDP